VSVNGSDSGSYSGPGSQKRKRPRRTRGLTPARNWERVDDLMNEIRGDGHDHQSFRLRDRT